MLHQETLKPLQPDQWEQQSRQLDSLQKHPGPDINSRLRIIPARPSAIVAFVEEAGEALQRFQQRVAQVEKNNHTIEQLRCHTNNFLFYTKHQYANLIHFYNYRY